MLPSCLLAVSTRSNEVYVDVREPESRPPVDVHGPPVLKLAERINEESKGITNESISTFESD